MHRAVTLKGITSLEDKLVLFFTGFTRSASAMLENLHFIKQVGCETQAAFEQGDLRRFAELMQVHWQYKKKRSAGVSNPAIDRYYELALRHGALGGKLIGGRRRDNRGRPVVSR